MPNVDSIWCFPGKLIKAVDGDTADIELDLGLRQYTRDRFRLLGVNTPERGKPGYHEAKKFLQDFYGLNLLVFTSRTGKYGRWLAEIYVEGNQEKSINESILDLKLGVPYGK